MNPADVAQSALPVANADVSLIALFLQAHWIVKAVMLGLLSCSVWVWAIAIDKMFLYSRTRRPVFRAPHTAFRRAFDRCRSRRQSTDGPRTGGGVA